MIKKTIVVTPKLGLHAKPAGMFVREAGRFKSEIMVAKEDVEINGKSVMQLLLLAAEHGAHITLKISGPDEGAALAALEKLFADKFGEE